MAKGAMKKMLKRLSRTFLDAVLDRVEPVFNSAAEGEDSKSPTKVKWHKKNPIGIPVPKFHAMTGQAERTHEVRRSRIESKAGRAAAMGRPDYYGSFEKVNSLKM